MATALITPDQDAVVSEIQIAAPPERVFRAISDASELKRWFTSPEAPVQVWEMDARLGGQYRYKTEKGSIVVNDVRGFECHSEILECEPPRVLVYTWVANWHDEKNARTVVRWDLTPMHGGTLVKVTHSGLSQLPVARKDYSGGWVGVIENLKKFVEGRE